MATKAKSARLAVLIDADNAPPQIVAGLFKEIAKLGDASVRRIYGDFSGTKLKSWADALAAHAIVPHQVFGHIPGKNATDIALVIDAMDLLHSGRFDGFCLVSSDSDFTRLAARIREQGLDVFGFGEKKTPASLVQACKKFTYVEAILPKPPPERTLPLAPEPPPPDAKPPKSKKAAKKQPKPEPPPPPPPAVQKPKPVQEAVPLLLDALASRAGDGGWARLDQVGFDLATLSPGFSAKKYGCPRLTDLVERSGHFEIRRQGGEILAIRARPEPLPPKDAAPVKKRIPIRTHPADDDMEIPF